MKQKKFEELIITDDFMFGKVMQNKEICKHFIEVLLQVKIRDIKYPEPQKTIDITSDGKGIRLDVYVEDDESTVYDLEMQTTCARNLPKRSRYYQGMIDLNLIKKGESYEKLKKTFIIFICTFDFFGEGRAIYTFENTCREVPELTLGDDSVKIFLNPTGNKEGMEAELQEVLNYFENQTAAPGGFSGQIETEVKKVLRHEEWRNEFMTLFLRDQEKYEEGLEDGEKRGQFKTLFSLFEKGRITKEVLMEETGLSESELEEKKKEIEKELS